jgi:hypothetical protein
VQLDTEQDIKDTQLNTIITVADLYREDLLATAARVRQVATVLAPDLPWRMQSVRVVALTVRTLGLRG